MSPTNQSLLFDDLGFRRVQADFSAGPLTSDGGLLLLRQIDRGLGLTRNLAGCFTDLRNPLLIDHSVQELLAQRLNSMALGYEDINDHDTLRLDPLLAVAAGKTDPCGNNRLQDRGVALAAPSTLNRLELGNNKTDRYHKISYDPQKIEQTLLDLGVRCLPKYAEEIILDLDGMGHLVHGLQEGRHFSAYYDGYCYQPLYVVCGNAVLWAQLRTGHHDPKEDVVAALRKIIAAVRQRCPKARILVRGDGGFCREELMVACEQEWEVQYVLGLPKNSVLVGQIQEALAWAQARRCLTGQASAREFREFDYQTQKSWSQARRVVAKAEATSEGPNPRFVVTNLPKAGFGQGELGAQKVYEEIYCGRGDMENILKQQTLDLGADRMSTHYMASNQLRLWLATFAYMLIERLRALTLSGTELARATAGTIRVKLLKVAAVVHVSVRRVYLQMSSTFPMQELFGLCLKRLKEVPWQET
jgi:Transposase DDE domain group 1